MSKSLFTFEAAALNGESTPLDQYRGKVLLIVNTASQCGLTPQFEGLESLYTKYKDRGLVILGFPCNQFKQQDPDSDANIHAFCQKNYGVTFPMFRKIEVNGDNAHPLYMHLKKQARGVFGSETIKWNFTKFLVGKDGKVIKRYAPATRPEKLEKAIEEALNA